MLEVFGEELAAESQRLLPRRLLRKVDVDDVVQEVLRRAYRSMSRLSGQRETAVRAYLIKTLESVILDQVRHYDRGKRRMSLERALTPDPLDPSAGLAGGLRSDHTSPTQKARRNEQTGRLEAALSGLPADQRRAIELRYIRQMSQADTAAAMNKTETAVAGLVRRGLDNLRTRLGPRAD